MNQTIASNTQARSNSIQYYVNYHSSARTLGFKGLNFDFQKALNLIRCPPSSINRGCFFLCALLLCFTLLNSAHFKLPGGGSRSVKGNPSHRRPLEESLEGLWITITVFFVVVLVSSARWLVLKADMINQVPPY